MIKYYLIESEIKEGEAEYWNKWIISSETEAPDHADLEISVWNWAPYGQFNGSYFDEGTRWVRDYIITEIPESDIKIASKYLNNPISFEFDKDFDPKDYWEEG